MAESFVGGARNAPGGASPLGFWSAIAAGLAAGMLVGFLDAAWLLLHAGTAAGGALFFARTMALYAVAGVLGAVAAGLPRAAFRRRGARSSGLDGGRTCFTVVTAAGLFSVTTVHFFAVSMSRADKFVPRVLAPTGAALALAAIAWIRRRRKPRESARRSVRWLWWVVVPASLATAYGLLFALVDASERRRGGEVRAADRALPNVVLVVMDATRADRMSAYGHFRPTTPCLERLAREGVRFENAYTPANWTAPAHASLFTGRFASDHAVGWTRTRLAAEVPTLAEILSARGYRTLSLHDNAFTGRLVGLDRGFDEEWGVEAESRIDSALALVLDRLVLRRGCSPRLVEVARRWIAAAQQDRRPAFVFVHFNDAHAPYRPREPFFGQFSRDLDLSGVDLGRVRRVNADRHAFHRFLSGEVALSPGDFEYLKALYDSEIAFVDEQLGRLLRGLEADRALDDTIVVIAADHGESIGEHGLMGHHVLLYNEVLRIPLLIWAPGRVAPGVNTSLASLVDVTPTILGLAGLAGHTPAGVQGRDLLSPPAPGMDPPPPAPRAVFAEWRGLLLSRPRERLEKSIFGKALTAQQIFAFIERGGDKDSAKAAIRGPWKLLWVSDGRIELYDLAGDPGETRNIAAERPDLVRELAAALVDGIRQKTSPARAPEDEERDFEQTLRSLGYIH